MPSDGGLVEALRIAERIVEPRFEQIAVRSRLRDLESLRVRWLWSETREHHQPDECEQE
jgi:hypothetical protein